MYLGHIDCCGGALSNQKVRSFLQEHLFLWRQTGLAVLVLQLTCTALDQWINGRLEQLMNSSEGPGLQFWIWALASLLNSLIFPLLITLCWLAALAARRGGGDVPSFVARHGNQLAIETLRSWGSALTWGLFLILPAFVRLFMLSLVPYVVTFSKSYSEGKLDALKTSSRLVGRHWFLVGLVMLVFSTLIPMILASGFDQWRHFAENPLSAGALTLFDVLVSALTAQLLFRLFERSLKEENDELVLRLEGN